MSFITQINSSGPSIEACCTPHLIPIVFYHKPHSEFGQLFSNLKALPLIPYAYIFFRRISCRTVSKAFFKSINAPITMSSVSQD